MRSSKRRGWAVAAGTQMGAILAGVAIISSAAVADTPYIAWTRATIILPTGAPRGYLEFQNTCSVCHGAMPERPGTRALAAKYKGSEPALLEERTDLSPEFIRLIVRRGITVMPPFRKTEVSDADLDAIIAYLTRKRP
jgi:mono/diheme cytochrome c family protein